MPESEDIQRALRERLNVRVMEAFERSWPTAYRELGRMARARWHIAPLGERPHARWRFTTTPELLEPPDPPPLERQLGIVSACIHVDVQCQVRGAIEGWTVTFRAFEDCDEVQLTGARTRVSAIVTPAMVRNLLRLAANEGPGYYPLERLPSRRRRRSPIRKRGSAIAK